MGNLATYPPPPWGSPLLPSGRQNEKWPSNGESAYITRAALGVPTASQRGQNQNCPTNGQRGYKTPTALGVPTASEREAESKVAHTLARWLHNLCPLGGPDLFRAEGRI